MTKYDKECIRIKKFKEVLRNLEDINCKRCGIKVKRRNFNQKYCFGCSKLSIKELNNKYNKKRIEYFRKWRLAHPEIITNRCKIWRENNPEKYKSHIYANTHNLKDSVCKICGTDENLHFHHTDYINNKGFTVCALCHSRIHNG